MAGPDVNQAVESVTIDDTVAILLALHGAKHPTTCIHGILVGKKTSSTSIRVTDAYPVCHETPTFPLVDLAISLVSSKLDNGDENKKEKKEIVGWYTAPELLEDTQPGPVALRVVANLASASPGPSSSNTILVVLNNTGLIELVSGDVPLLSSCSSFVNAFGKDFGGQWMEKIKDVKVHDDTKAVQGLRKVVADSVGNTDYVKDLTDHWQAGATSEWTSSSDLQKYL